MIKNPGNVYVIAEIGQNHQGDKEIAKELMVLAKQCGANCVKFQKSDLQAKFNKAALDRPYGGPNSWGPTYGKHKTYSGHEVGYEPTLTAVKLGACIVERHLTLNKEWKGSDHASSLTPREFTDMIHKIRLIGIATCQNLNSAAAALGSFKKDIQTSEIACINKLGKSLVAGRYLHKGHVLTSADIEIKVAEPFGIPCRFYTQVIGYTLLKDVEEDQTILLKDIMRPPLNTAYIPL